MPNEMSFVVRLDKYDKFRREDTIIKIIDITSEYFACVNQDVNMETL